MITEELLTMEKKVGKIRATDVVKVQTPARRTGFDYAECSLSTQIPGNIHL